eukprot:TRINITY_DN4805_c0_g2_i1.p1 TRINITY_DN4805_c0_g2~~TRINITY_DN4805_c0_g2_i1.p1  ORF type:complete len:122 (-),score=2.55 TRINITY_DN4805_c0_g2_i1:2-367(-)
MLGQLTLLWKSFLNHRAWFNSNISWVVGNGLKVNVLYDKWVPGLEYLSVLLKLGANKYFIKTDSNSGALFWDTDLIRCFLEEDIMQLMTSIPLVSFRERDETQNMREMNVVPIFEGRLLYI